MILISNKRIYKDYTVGAKFEAGIELFGHEIKSIKSGKANLNGSKVIVRGGEAFLVGSHIDPFQPNNIKTKYVPERTIKLLLNKKEIKELYKIEEEKKGFILPLNIFEVRNKLKLEFAICQKLNNHNNKQKIKESDLLRQIKRDASNWDYE